MSILQVEPYDSKVDYDPDHQILGNDIVQKFHQNLNNRKNRIWSTSDTLLDPNILCVLAPRPEFFEKYPYACYMLALGSLLINICLIAINITIYLEGEWNWSHNQDNYDIFQRGLDDLKYKVLRVTCMGLLYCITFPAYLKAIKTTLIQIMVFQSIHFHHFVVPIICGISIVLDLINIFLVMIVGMVSISEIVNTSTMLTFAEILVTFIILFQLRSYLSSTLLVVIGFLTFCDEFSSKATSYFNDYALTSEELQRFLITNKIRGSIMYVFGIIYTFLSIAVIYILIYR